MLMFSLHAVSQDGKSTLMMLEGRKNIHGKVLLWFPLKSRLQRVFMSSKTVSSMTLREDIRTRDRLMRHPTNSFAWKDFDRQYPNF